MWKEGVTTAKKKKKKKVKSVPKHPSNRSLEKNKMRIKTRETRK